VVVVSILVGEKRGCRKAMDVLEAGMVGVVLSEEGKRTSMSPKEAVFSVHNATGSSYLPVYYMAEPKLYYTERRGRRRPVVWREGVSWE
jgi:hypothetical protein